MATQRLPVTASLDPETSTSSESAGILSKNVIYDRYPDNRSYATQRPAITITAEPEDFSIPNIGRGAYYWDKVSSYYIVNYDTVYQGYGVSAGTITAGRDRVDFCEVGNYLVLIDGENNEGWYIESSAPTTINAISDLDFPPNQTPSLNLAGGVVTLDGYLLVLDTNGTVWQSDLRDPTSWNALNFITAEREADGGLFIAKHYDQVVVIGSKTVEFFYNAANLSGSILSRRQDVSYRVGCIDRKAVYVSADRIVFVGIEQGGTVGLYSIEGFQLNKISGMAIDEHLSFLGLRRQKDFIVSMGMLNDHYLVFLTPVLPNVDGSSRPIWEAETTIVCDLSTKLWFYWELGIKDLSGFPIISFADKIIGNDRTVTFQYLTGEMSEITGNLEPYDTIGAKSYFEDPDYIINQQDYIIEISQDEQSYIEMLIRIPEYDLDNMNYKFGHYLWVVGTSVKGGTGSSPLQIRWTDDHYNTFSPYRDIDITTRRKLTRLGKFRRRAHELKYQGEDTLRIEALEIFTGNSQYA